MCLQMGVVLVLYFGLILYLLWPNTGGKRINQKCGFFGYSIQNLIKLMGAIFFKNQTIGLSHGYLTT